MAGLVELYPRFPLGRNNAAVAATAVNVKTSTAGGFLLGGNAFNPHAADVAYLQVFDAAAANVVLGTTVPVFTVAVPPRGSVVFDPPRPIQCETGLSYAATATQLGAGAPSAPITMWLAYV